MLKTVVLHNIFMETVTHFIFQDSQMNRKFKRAAFIWSRSLTSWRCLPEEALAALAGHGVEVESGGLVSTHSADPRRVTVKLILTRRGRAHGHGVHHWNRARGASETTARMINPQQPRPHLHKSLTFMHLAAAFIHWKTPAQIYSRSVLFHTRHLHRLKE